jgi:predicted ATP-grasp superfamily ATP-dependent carboligase
VVCPVAGHPLLKTRRARRTFQYSGLHPLESLRTAINATKPQMVIPCDDRSLQHLHELYSNTLMQGSSGRAIVELIERSLGSPESIPIVSSRYKLLEIAREEGLLVPPTKPIRTSADVVSWAAEHPGPYVLKADGTFGGRGVRIAQNREAGQQAFMELAGLFGFVRAVKRLIVNRDSFWFRPWWKGSKPTMIVQSFVHGRPANCAVLCSEGKVLAGLGVEVVATTGPTGPASLVRVVDNPQMMRAAQKIAQRLGLSGFFGLDFMIEEETESAYLVEMNPRSTPLCHLQLGPGRDMVSAMFAQLVGRPLYKTPSVTQKELIAYFPQAWTLDRTLLDSSFQDVPWGELDLIQDLLQPWPDRSLLYRLVTYLSRTKTTETATLSPVRRHAHPNGNASQRIRSRRAKASQKGRTV